jgi:aspartate/methionine/tyrosine aminotransferase
VSLKPINPTVSSFQESIFSKMTKLAMKEGAINLAQGFPDFEGPQWMLEALVKEFHQKKNQYTPSWGSLNLRESVGNFYQKYYQATYSPQNEILITAGATEGIFLACQALLSPGDEVVLLAPYYDSYAAAVSMAGGVARVVNLSAPEFQINLSEIEKVCSEKTKLLILNSPHNPTGRVFARSELEVILELAQKYNFYILSDEVYEFLTYETKFESIAALPGAKERVIRLSSVGKTLSFTGWKIGWAVGPAPLIAAMHMAHQFVTFCLPGPLQEGVAHILNSFDDYLVELKVMYQGKRDFFVQQMRLKGAEVLVPQGSYFVLIKIPSGPEASKLTDLEYCEQLASKHKLAAIPLSAFYPMGHAKTGYVRFCFAKESTTLQNGAQRYPG